MYDIKYCVCDVYKGNYLVYFDRLVLIKLISYYLIF